MSGMVIIMFLFCVMYGGLIGCILLLGYMNAHFIDDCPSPEENPGLWVICCLYGVTTWLVSYLICFVFEGVLST